MAAPAGPLIQGSTTPMAKETATDASTALPPPARTSTPISAARRCCAATMPWAEEVAGLRGTWEREKDMETPPDDYNEGMTKLCLAPILRSERHRDGKEGIKTIRT